MAGLTIIYKNIMTIYVKNTETNEIIGIEVDSYESLSKNFRQAPYEQCSEAEIAAEELQEAKDERTSSRSGYLSSTDWYIARESDESGSYPQAIKDKRIQARTEINEIEALTTLAEVEAYNINFE